MTTSSMVDELEQPLRIQTLLTRILNCRVIGLEQVSGGKNGRVYKVICENNTVYAAKQYFYHYLDRRNRLENEFFVLQFLWEHGIRCIPKPFTKIDSEKIALFEYVEGSKVSSNEVESQDINALVEFLIQLDKLRHDYDCAALPLASEACFSFQAMIAAVENRLSRLLQTPRETELQQALYSFLEDSVVPTFHQIESWCRSRQVSAKLSWEVDSDIGDRILSPSDFGFHNALRLKNGKLTFFDFEYFGWDDPAKAIADVLFHPGMQLTNMQKTQLTQRAMSNLQHYRNLPQRLEIAYPLCGLKWCLLILNEFVPEHLLRRGFATNLENRQQKQIEQLEKAKQVLSRIIAEYESFPYYEVI